MSDQSAQHHPKTKTTRDTRKGRDRVNDLPKINSVIHALNMACACYNNNKYASDPLINHCEDWLNGSVNADRGDVEAAIASGRIKKSQSSGRLFIQLGVHG